MRFERPVYVTRPLLPPIDAYRSRLDTIWNTNWLTNKGALHDELERRASAYLRTPNLSLVGSGTTALMLALRGLGVSGEVITTPFTFPATVNAIFWCGLTPVFADIDPAELTIDPDAVADAITPRTGAILGVHVFGVPCRTAPLKTIADTHGIKLIYDGAHAFGTEVDGEPIASFGDATAFSFHATKLFNSAEGGAVATGDPDLKATIDLWKNLGIQDEVTLALPGLNGRMNEFEAALGIANLDLVDAEREARADVRHAYVSRLSDMEGIVCIDVPAGVRNSQTYFAVRIENRNTISTRNFVHEGLKQYNVFTRRYFYPLCSNTGVYGGLASADPVHLPVANTVSDEILCLPFFGALGADGAHRICDLIDHLLQTAAPAGRASE